MRYEGPGFYGLNPPLWVSGATIAKGQWVTSPADNEIYQRIAATGGGTTDPADDVTNYVARSYRRIDAIPEGRLVSMGTTSLSTTAFTGATKVVIGAITVGTRTEALSITGRGSLLFLASVKNAAGTFRVEIIVDGRTVSDYTTTMNSTNSLVHIGSVAYEASAFTDSALSDVEPVQFRRSLKVYLTPVTAAASAGCGIAYVARGAA